MLVDNSDATEQRFRLLRADIDAARRLLGEAEPLLFPEAMVLDAVTDDHALTIQRLEAAEAAGASDSYVMWGRAAMLMYSDRLDEAIPVVQAIAARDPGNIEWLQGVPAMLGAAHRPIEALRLRRVIMERFPQLPHLATAQGHMIFGFSGKAAAWRFAFDQVRSVLVDSQALVGDWGLLRFERRYADLKRALGNLTNRAIPVSPFSALLLLYAGRRPTAVYLGWAELLNENTALAADAGHAVLEFVVNEPQTRWNPWFLKTLAAEAHLMIGNNCAAITAAREALMLTPRKKDTLRSSYASAVAARVFAWAGAEDEAVTLLEQLAVLQPGLPPAEITRDPLYFIPLTESSRYRAFAERLEVQIENYDAEFRKLHLDRI
jgi:predicted Zn-dependent protease